MRLPDARIFVAKHPVHMGRSFDGLQKLVDELDVTGRIVVVFTNKRETAAKVYWRDRSGQSIFYKRLDGRAFRLPSVDEGAKQVRINANELARLLEGVPLPKKTTTRREIATQARESALQQLKRMAKKKA